jgi:hypothetical protein
MTRDDEPELDPLLRSVTSELRRPAPTDPWLASRVLAEVRKPAPRRALEWFFRPRQVPLSPAAGLLWAAAIAGLAFFIRPIPSGAPVEGVQFVLFAPSASSVALVGDFNDWDPSATQLVPSEDRSGAWQVALPLSPGRHEYAFVIDGTEWRPDPAAPAGSDPEFGTPNSIVTVRES